MRNQVDFLKWFSNCFEDKKSKIPNMMYKILHIWVMKREDE
jgi:hypothetical protein